MYRIFLFFLLIACLCWSCNPFDKKPGKIVRKKGSNNVNIEIPDQWIEKVRHFDYSRDNKALLHEFESFIKPDTLANPNAKHVDDDYGRIFNTMFIDLDGEPGEELICLLGWDIYCPDLCVFKQIDGSWHLIYIESINTFYSSPTLGVANCFSKNKTFYLRRVYDHGSGIYEDGYSFYKLINTNVYHCLELVNEAHVYGWGLYMNQEIKMSFEFAGDDSDKIGVDYTYNFFPGAIDKSDCSWCVNTDISLIKGEDRIYYEWDAKRMIYKPDEPLDKDNKSHVNDLNAKKIACFGDFGNDSLFVEAFGMQIKEVLKNGTKQQKKILTDYLVKVKKDKTVITEKIEKKSETGSTSFYGPVKKE